MRCVSAKKQIFVDSQFVNLDKNGRAVSWKSGMKKLIQSQIGHELIHAFSYMESDGCVGMIRRGNVDYSAVNEGVTQMVTEDAFGYVVSPLSDYRYKHFKKFAKILQTTFGADNCIYDDYIFHTNKLKNKCNSFVGDNNFFDLLNYRLSAILHMPEDNNYIVAKNATYDLLYEELVCKIIIPQVKQMSDKERETYIYEIMKCVADDIDVTMKMKSLIEKYAQLDSQKYQRELNSLDEKLADQDRVNYYLKLLENKQDKKYEISDLFQVSKSVTGKLILHTKQHPQIIIEDDNLKETILAQTIRDEMGGKDSSEFNNFKDHIKANLAKDKTISLDCSDVETARKKLCAIKKVANANGYTVLADLSDVTPNEIIKIESIRTPWETKQGLSFADLRKIVGHLNIKSDDNNSHNMFSVNRKTGIKIQDPKLDCATRFGASWLSAAGTKYFPDEEISGITYAFNDGSERVFNKIMETAQKQLQETGTVDFEDLILTAEENKYAGDIVRNLFSNEWKRKVFVQFVSSITSEALLQTENARNRYGIDLSDFYADETVDSVKGI